MSYPLKLTAAQKQELERILSADSLDAASEQDRNRAHDLDAELTELLDRERSNRGLEDMTPERRRYLALTHVNALAKSDGLLTGVAVNDPKLISACADTADALGLDELAELLAEAVTLLPPGWEHPSSTTDPLHWYRSPEGSKAAQRLEALEERFHSTEPVGGYTETCLRYALQHADEFFER